MADRFEDAARVRSGRRPFLLALAFVACFAAPGAAEPQVSCEGSFGFLAGDDVDIGPVFSLRVLHTFSPMLHGGVEAASGIAQKLELPYALPTQGPSLARQTERFQYLDVVVVVRSARGPYAILGAGVYDRVTYAQSYGFQGVVIHEAAPGGSAGLGFSKGRRISPFVEFRMHAHGRIGGETWSRPGSSVDFLWTGAGGLAFQF